MEPDSVTCWTLMPTEIRLAIQLITAVATLLAASLAHSQTANISDAWWSFQQDCDGDGCRAGTLSGNQVRLNWNPSVTNCSGTLTVFEKVYYKSCASGTWTAIHTNAPHSITGCSSSDVQHLDLPMASGCTCRDYKVEIYRNGQAQPDYIRSSTNDVDLAQHHEELLTEDFCLSDQFATCAALNGPSGSQTDNNSTATKEAGEPNHAGNPGGKSLWYCWTAETNYPVTIDTVGSAFDTLLAVYTGSSVSALSLVVSNDDIAGSTNRQSRVTFTPIPGTTYHIAVDGYGGGSGIVVVNWRQSAAALPDLIFWGDAVSATTITRTLATNDCEVLEGCATPGTRRLLSFTTETRNIGTGDLVLGDPSTNSLFHYASCHGHYHFEEFARYELLDLNENVVVTGNKVGFCLLDDHAWSPTANPQAIYTCYYQGLQAGWADVYAAGLPCQYIDITGVPAGDYLLRMALNPAGLIVEANTNNNITVVPVTIPPADCTTAPTNDTFASAMVVPGFAFTFLEFNNCATKQTGEPNHGGDSGGHSIWFNWTAPSNHTAVITTKRSNFDTLLAVYTGSAVSGLTLVASNDDLIPGVSLQSQVSFAASSGVTYRIAIDGWGGAVGAAVLNINPPANDDFTNAYLISGVIGTTNGLTAGASKELSEPAHAFDVGGHSIWYRWIAPSNGPVEFSTTGSSYDTTLAVYTGTNVTNLTMVAANNNDAGGPLTSRLSFTAAAGTTYRIAVDGSTGDFGIVKLNWNMLNQLALTILPGGVRQLNLTGVNWQRYRVLVSSNLKTWSTQTTVTMSGGAQQFIETTNAPKRFYRTQLVP